MNMQILSDGYSFTSDVPVNFEAPINNIKYNKLYMFTAQLTDIGNGITIGHGTTQYASAYMEIDGANVTVTNFAAAADTVKFEHGLVFSGFLTVLLNVGYDRASVTIRTGATEFTKSDIKWMGYSNANDYFINNTVCGKNKLVITYREINKPIFTFGDSYLSVSSEKRWPYYLRENGFLNNNMFNAYPGQSSSTAVTAFSSIIALHKPMYAVWCMGMNDGSDSDTGPSASWLKNTKEFLDICTGSGIIPILSTVPTVPSINHEMKNKWVRSSGFRYIDFAYAVGATPDGAWHEGMLYSDNVHPDVSGAKALFMQAVTDFPEYTLML